MSAEIESQLVRISDAAAKRLIGPGGSAEQCADVSRVIRGAINESIVCYCAVKSGEVSESLMSNDDLSEVIERYNAMGGNRDIINLVSDVRQLWREKEADNKLLQAISMAIGKMPGAQQ